MTDHSALEAVGFGRFFERLGVLVRISIGGFGGLPLPGFLWDPRRRFLKLETAAICVLRADWTSSGGAVEGLSGRGSGEQPRDG